MYSAFDFFWQNSFVAIPATVECSTWISVVPYFQTISFRVVRIGTAVCELMKMVPYWASFPDTMTLRMILHTTIMIPLTVGTKFSWFLGVGGPSLIQWTPLAWIQAWETESYDALECMANCIKLALTWISAFGLEAKYFRSLANCFAVFLVALECSEEMSLRAGRIVLSMTMA